MTAPTIKLDTAEQCAWWLRVDVATIRSWGKRGIVKSYGGLFRMTELADYVDKREKTGRPVKRATCTNIKIMSL